MARRCHIIGTYFYSYGASRLNITYQHHRSRSFQIMITSLSRYSSLPSQIPIHIQHLASHLQLKLALKIPHASFHARINPHVSISLSSNHPPHNLTHDSPTATSMNKRASFPSFSSLGLTTYLHSSTLLFLYLQVPHFPHPCRPQFIGPHTHNQSHLTINTNRRLTNFPSAWDCLPARWHYLPTHPPTALRSNSHATETFIPASPTQFKKAHVPLQFPGGNQPHA